jgi:hypothetical protein
MQVKVSELPHRELYNIILSSVAPRPIAWVSTLSAAGHPNLDRSEAPASEAEKSLPRHPLELCIARQENQV